MASIVTSDIYKIQFHEVDYKRRLLITSLVNYFCDCAMKQTEEINMGLDFMDDHNMAWIIYRWDITLLKYPMYHDKINVKTWGYSFRKFYAYRKFEVFNEQGEIIAKADSVWFLLDTTKRRPKRIEDYMYDAYNVDKNFDKALEIEKLADPITIETEKKFNVRYSDIDTNLHVNNAKYIAWAVETIPIEIVKECFLKNIVVNYEKETTYGDMINAETQVTREGNDTICLSVIRDKEGKGLSRIKTIWGNAAIS